MESFREKVHRVVRAIPRGSVLTYQQVAQKIGHPRAFRAVGTVLKANFDPSIPCHRVIRSDGSLGQYNRGEEVKRRCLEMEGYLK